MTNILWVFDLTLGLLDIRQTELQLLLITSNFTSTKTMHNSEQW
jgi:hypothetical protein